MIQSLSSEDREDDVITLDDDDKQGGNSDSGFIIETTPFLDLTHWRFA